MQQWSETNREMWKKMKKLEEGEEVGGRYVGSYRGDHIAWKHLAISGNGER
jgi:hypothetical protein